MATDETLPLVLRKLGNLQKLELRDLDWSTLTVDLIQLLCWVLELPSITMLAIARSHFARLGDFFNFIFSCQRSNRPRII
jgi:hypothetical protein